MKQDILQRDNIPEALLTILSYARSLSFMERPDYDHLRMLVKGLCTNPLDPTPKPEWLCGDNTLSMYELRPFVCKTNKLVARRSIIDKRRRYLYTWYDVFENRLMIEYQCYSSRKTHCCACAPRYSPTAQFSDCTPSPLHHVLIAYILI